MTEALFPDGSMASFNEGGGSFHAGDMAMNRVRLVYARSALKVYIESGGRMQVTRNGHKNAVVNVIEPLSGKRFTSPTGRLSFAGCRKALDECDRLLAELEGSAVIWQG